MVELPAGPTAGGVSDFWQREFAVVGEMGPDGAGRPAPRRPAGSASARPPTATTSLQATGMNIMFGFRTLDPDPQRAQALVDAVRIYPYVAA